MPYREKKIYSGKMLEVEVYPISIWDRKQPRKKKEKSSPLKQKNLNDKNAKKHLIRLINRNFTDRDLSICLTYAGKQPEDEEEARKDVTNYIRRIKHYRKKQGLPALKYIAVIEHGEKKGRIHHHLIMSGDMDRDIVEQLWNKGRGNADRLKADENGFEGLGRYISKDPKGCKRWVQSKNLKQPVVKINDFKYSKRKVTELAKSPDDREVFQTLYPDYLLNECKVEINQVTAGTYLYIKMRKLKI